MWQGWIPRELPRLPASATYSIDGSNPVSFQLNGLRENEGTAYNQIFFTTPELKPGPHTLELVHQGSKQQTPLTMHVMYIANNSYSGPLPSALPAVNLTFPSSSNPSGSPSPSSSGTPGGSSASGGSSANAESTKNSTPAGAIAGGVIGALALVALIAFAIFFFRRRKQRSRNGSPHDKLEPITPYYDHQAQNIPFDPAMMTQSSYPLAASAAHSRKSTMPTRLSYVNTDPYASAGSPLTPLVPQRLSTSTTAYHNTSTPIPSSQSSEASSSSGKNRLMSPVSGSGEGPSSTTLTILRHEDSGIRLPLPQPEVEELPPNYTPS